MVRLPWRRSGPGIVIRVTTTIAERIEKTAQRYEHRAVERTRRRDALADLRGGTGDPGDLASRVDAPVRIATRAVNAGLATSTGEVLAAPRATTAAMLERIIGASDLLPARFLHAGTRRASAVGRLVIRSAGGVAGGFGTAFLIGPHVVMTNHHVLGDADSAAASIVQFGYWERRGGQVLPTPVALQPARLFATDEALDFTVVATATTAEDGSAVNDLGWVPLLGPSGKALVGERVNIIQHPGGQPGQIAIHGNTVVDVVDHFLHYDTDTNRGSSGSPVFNNEWDLAALHHSGVPARDDAGNILLTSGAIWDGNPATESQIRWIANEGVRVSVIVDRLRQLLAAGDHRGDPVLLQRVLTAGQSEGATLTEDSGPRQVVGRPRIVDGRAEWDVVVSVDLAGLEHQTEPPAPAGEPADREYYDPVTDEEAAATYYASIDPAGDALFASLSTMVTTTHTTQLTYREARLDHLYPNVDLHPDRQLRSVYSDAHLDRDEVIAAELAVEDARQRLLREFTTAERFDPSELRGFLAQLEADHRFNCEHVVPQSWFGERQPMRSDLHHLFTCDPGCNSFRSNIAYWDFPEEEEALRAECGRTGEGRKFEPAANHAAVARATLYFLLRYPSEIGDSLREFPAERLPILLAWNAAYGPSDWERHRNAEIAKVQGNRNPIIDHPEWADRIDFMLGLASIR